LLHEGIRRQNAGQNAQAAHLYRQVPPDDPYHADALNLLGTIAFQEGRPVEAAQLIEAAVKTNPRNAAAWGNLGGVAKQMQRPDIAVPCYRRAVLLAPDRLDTVAGLSLVEEPPARAASLRRRLVMVPLDKNAFVEIGNDLFNAGDFGAAAEAFRRVQIIDPAEMAGAFNLGNSLRDLGAPDTARTHYDRALAIAPTTANVLNNRGLLAFRTGAWEEAERYFAKAVEASADHAAGWFNRARCLQKMEREDEAIPAFKRGLVIDPQNVPPYCDVAGLIEEDRWALSAMYINPFASEPYNRLALLATRDPTRAQVLRRLRQGACVRPDDADAWYNIGVELGRTGDPVSAAKYGWLATRIRDGHALAHLNTALSLLVQERFEEGWEEHRRRLDSPDAAPFVRYFSIPEWVDQDLAGRKLLIWGEQGIGDEVQFLTLAPHLMRRGASLVVLTEPRIRPILRRSLPQIEVPEVPGPSGQLEDHFGCDMQVALGDVPHRLKLFCGGTDWPQPWVLPDGQRIRELKEGLRERHPGKKLVGITWRSVAPKTGERRTIPIEMWRDIVHTPGVAVISLQYGLKQEDLDTFREANDYQIDAFHGVEPILDLDGLAALVATMDLVLCPANNTVHFSGAMGKPCWTLLPTKPDWRWGLTRENSLWYPNTRVFRQADHDDWAPVMARVAAELKSWAAG
jgi:tetratricopeptide (TPR) repeat protein/ADP-heptose:LPS heptosyltransferase